jgi:hypothetical protein
MDFGEVLGSAWRIIWKHKILWIFGILAGCARGGGGGGGGNGWRFNAPNGGTGQAPQWMTNFGDWIGSHPWAIALFVLAILIIIIVALLVGTIGRIALIKGTQKADAGAERLGFGELWTESLPYFWRIFLLGLLIFVAVLIVVIPIVGLSIGLTALTFGLGVLCLIPLMCVLVIAAWLLSLVVQQAETAIVLENLGIADGLRRGWNVFRENIGPMLLMWLILVVIGFIAGLLIAIPVLIVLVPAMIAFFATNANTANPSFVPLAVAALCFVAYLPFLLVLNGILIAYLQSAWTLTYMRLTRPKEKPLTESPVIPAPNA